MLPYEDDEHDFSEYNESAFESVDMARGVYEALAEEWQANEEGFDYEEIYSMIDDISNYEEWYDDEGNLHCEFDYHWSNEDGSYQGSGHISH
jgi:hypothetical protein